MLRRMECGSARCGKVPEGCVRCIEGSKMVLLVTGKCGWGCDYCPVSLEKKGRDVVYANEMRVATDEEIVAEAEAMDARGTGITGGDPLIDMDRTVHCIRLLKDRFGPDHHIHLYTATIDPGKAKVLEDAGLDELRLHPRDVQWSRMADTKLKEVVEAVRIPVGIEIPALPRREDDILAMIAYARSVGVAFVNLNELEFSESNWDMMDIHGYAVKDDVSSAVAGSEETAMKVLKKARGMDVHFCSSAFKDGVQLRRRLIRRALNTTEAYQQVTEDGTIVRGFVRGDRDAIVEQLRELNVPDELFCASGDDVEVAPWVLENISGKLTGKAWLSEQYPTADGLEVERTPLDRGGPLLNRLERGGFRRDAGGSLDAEALDVVVPVHDVPGQAEVLPRLSDGAPLELGIDGHGGVGDVPALLDDHLLRPVDVEHVHHELLGVLGELHDLDVLPGELLELDDVLALLPDRDVGLALLDDEHELVLGVHAVDGAGLGDGLEEGDVPQRLLR